MRSLICCHIPDDEGSGEVREYAALLLARPDSVQSALDRNPQASGAVASLAASPAWSGLIHIPLSGWSARAKHADALYAATRAAATAGGERAGNEEPFVIPAAKWARVEKRGEVRRYEVTLWDKVMEAVLREIAVDGVVGSRKLNVNRRGKKLGVGFGRHAKEVSDFHMTRFLSDLEWDVAFVSRPQFDSMGEALAVHHRYPLGVPTGT